MGQNAVLHRPLQYFVICVVAVKIPVNWTPLYAPPPQQQQEQQTKQKQKTQQFCFGYRAGRSMVGG